MSTWGGILVALAIGLGSAVQTGMLGAMGRDRGPTEAAWVSLLGSIVGIAFILGFRAVRGDPPALPSPFDRVEAYLAVLVGAGAILTLALRNAEPYYAVTGLFGVAFIAGAALLVPSLGVALFFGAATAGSVVGALVVDHVGAFGATPHPVSLARLAGLGLLLVGVVVVRTAK